MNATSGKLTVTLARIPILGYVLKVAHDFLKLPVVRADLHSEFLDVATRVSRQEAGLRMTSERIEQIQAGIEQQACGQETARAGVSEHLALLDSQMRAVDSKMRAIDSHMRAIDSQTLAIDSQTREIKDQFETLFQRVSDNLAEWIDLRQRLSVVASDSAANHQGFASQLEESAEKLREVQARIEAQEETFAQVLRRHGRDLASLQESVAAHTATVRIPLEALGGLVDMIKVLQSEMRPAGEGRYSSVDLSEPETSLRPLFENARSLSPEVRLNLGSARPVKFCLHVASAENVEADLVADPGELPFLPASIAEIYAYDLLERCSAKEGRRLLSYWSGLLRPEGILHLTVTDVESAARSFAGASSSFEDLTRAILGRKGGRQNAFSHEALHRLLLESGFHPVAEERVHDISAPAFEFEIHATKAVRQFSPRRTRSIASA